MRVEAAAGSPEAVGSGSGRLWRRGWVLLIMSGMRHVDARHALAAAASALSGVLVIGCASAIPAASTAGVTYTCCAQDLGTTTWRPGQQLRITWVPQGQPARGAGTSTLTAVLTGPYPTVTALKAANDRGTDRSRIVAAAPAIRASGSRVSSPVSIVTIPADAARGYYNLRVHAAAGNVASYGATIISVG
jgi:hypothetical protein